EPGSAARGESGSAARGESGRAARGEATAATLDEVPGGSAGHPTPTDTFAAQESDARRALPRPRTGLRVAGGVRPVGRARAAATPATLDEVPGGSAGHPTPTDTFASQESDARRALPRSRTGLLVAGGVLLVGASFAMVTLLPGGGAASEEAAPSSAAVAEPRD